MKHLLLMLLPATVLFSSCGSIRTLYERDGFDHAALRSGKICVVGLSNGYDTVHRLGTEPEMILHASTNFLARKRPDLDWHRSKMPIRRVQAETQQIWLTPLLKAVDLHASTLRFVPGPYDESSPRWGIFIELITDKTQHLKEEYEQDEQRHSRG